MSKESAASAPEMNILHFNPELADIIRDDQHAQELIAESEARSNESWHTLTTAVPEPLPLLPDQETAPPYPVDALGDVLSKAVKAIVEAVQVPDVMAAQSILAASAMAAQAHAQVIRAGQLIPLSLYFLTIAESGDRKTTADRLALKAHQEKQCALLKLFKAETKAYRNCRDAYQKARAIILEKNQGDPEVVTAELGKLKEPIEPPSPFLLLEEPTLEGLLKSLLSGHPSQGLFSDEGGQFFGGHANKPENLLKNVAGLCKLWDGTPIMRIRAAEGESASRSGCRLSIHLMIQPIVARHVLTNLIMLGQGFLARFRIAWSPSLAGARFYRDTDPNKDVRMISYWQRMTRLLAMTPPRDEHGEPAPQTLHLEPLALTTWIAAHDDIEAELGKGGELQEIKSTAAKSGEHILRMAGVMAVVEGAGAITQSLIERAVLLERWYLTEILRLTNPPTIAPKLLSAQSLLEWLQANKWQTFEARQLQQKGPRFVRKSASCWR